MHRTTLLFAALGGIALGTASCGERPAPVSSESTGTRASPLDSVPAVTRSGKWLKYYDVRNLVHVSEAELHLQLGGDSPPPDPAAESLTAQVLTLAPAADVRVYHGVLIVAMPRNEFDAVDRALEVRRREQLPAK